MAAPIKHTGLVLSTAKPTEWTVAGEEPDINPSGNWAPFKAQNEPQSLFRFDTGGCALFGTGHALVALAKFKGFQDFPQDISERFLGVISGTSIAGTDPHIVAESIRTSGLIPAEVLPWSDDLESFTEYYAPKPMDAGLLALGQALLDKFTFGHKWVFAFGSDNTPSEKTMFLQEALSKGTVCVSVDGAYRYAKGQLVKTFGAIDSHWVQLLRFNGKNAVIFDQYPPYIKTLAAGYDHNAAKVYFLDRVASPGPRTSFWDRIWNNFAKLWSGSKP